MEYKNLYPRVNKPSRYLGKEINTQIKNDEEIKIRYGLVFPDLYEIGSSHFGMQILYDILNKDSEIQTERIYVPLPEMRDELKKNNVSISGLKKKHLLKSLI